MPFVVQQNPDSTSVSPIVLPGTVSPSITTLHGISTSAVTMSPYDGSQQVQGSPAGSLAIEVDYPPMTRDEAEDLIAALLSLNGQYGTFMLGDDLGWTPRGAFAGWYNLLAASEELGNSTRWVPVGSGVAGPTVTSDAVNDDLGNLIAEQLDFPATAAGQYSHLSQTLAYQCGTGKTVTFSVWLRGLLPGPHVLQLILSDVSGLAATGIEVSVTDIWTRFAVTATFAGVDAAAVGMRVYIWQPQNSAACTIYACKAQLEYGAAVSAYQARTAAPCAFGAQIAGGNSIEAYGLTAGIRYLRAGDWIAIGKHLHKVLRDAVSGSDGHLVIGIFPVLREDIANNDAIYWLGARGEFRRTDDDFPWTIDQASLYGLKFTAMEAF